MKFIDDIDALNETIMLALGWQRIPKGWERRTIEKRLTRRVAKAFPVWQSLNNREKRLVKAWLRKLKLL